MLHTRGKDSTYPDYRLPVTFPKVRVALEIGSFVRIRFPPGLPLGDVQPGEFASGRDAGKSGAGVGRLKHQNDQEDEGPGWGSHGWPAEGGLGKRIDVSTGILWSGEGGYMSACTEGRRRRCQMRENELVHVQASRPRDDYPPPPYMHNAPTNSRKRASGSAVVVCTKNDAAVVGRV